MGEGAGVVGNVKKVKTNGFLVILENTIDDQKTQFILDAISMIKGVLDVKPIDDSRDIRIAESRIKEQVGYALREVYEQYLI